MRYLARASYIALFVLLGCGSGSGLVASPVPPGAGAPGVLPTPISTPTPGSAPTLAPATSPPAAPATSPPAAPVAAGETARQSDAFVDSVGINTHLHHNNTPYFDHFATFAQLIEAAGIRHLRDALVDTNYQPYYDHLNQLGLAGIHATLTTSVGQSASLLQAYPARVPAAFEAYEGPNEYDSSGDPNWVAHLTAFQRLLYSAVKGNPSTSSFPVLGPSLIAGTSAVAVGNQSGSLDYGNIHDYFAGNNPGTPGWGAWYFNTQYGSMVYNLRAEAQVSGSKPIIATETGYSTEGGASGAVPPDVQAKYVPRLFLEQFNAGIARTFEYQFADDDSSGADYFGSCGLTDFHLKPKPAYFALSSLIHLLSDPGPSFTTHPLVYTLSGSTNQVHHTLLQRRNGTYELALWIESASWDAQADAAVPVAPQAVTISLGANPKLATLATFNDAGVMSTSPVVFAGKSAGITLSDHVSIVTLVP